MTPLLVGRLRVAVGALLVSNLVKLGQPCGGVELSVTSPRHCDAVALPHSLELDRLDEVVGLEQVADVDGTLGQARTARGCEVGRSPRHSRTSAVASGEM